MVGIALAPTPSSAARRQYKDRLAGPQHVGGARISGDKGPGRWRGPAGSVTRSARQGKSGEGHGAGAASAGGGQLENERASRLRRGTEGDAARQPGGCTKRRPDGLPAGAFAG